MKPVTGESQPAHVMLGSLSEGASVLFAACVAEWDVSEVMASHQQLAESVPNGSRAGRIGLCSAESCESRTWVEYRISFSSVSSSCYSL